MEEHTMERVSIGKGKLFLAGGTPYGTSGRPLHFADADEYNAYVSENTEEFFGPGYRKYAEFLNWMKIYDDGRMTQKFLADKIIVYRAGETGCAIRLIKKTETDPIDKFFQEGNVVSGITFGKEIDRMTVDIGFSHTENDNDETEFDIPPYGWDELADLFRDFIVENHYEHVEVTYIRVVDLWTEGEDA